MKGGSTFSKNERIVSQKQIDELFAGTGSHSRAVFPLKVVYMIKPCDEKQPPAQVLVSVPKRRFRHAVDRNRVKRQLREAYRKNKKNLTDIIPAGTNLSLAFVWLSDKHLPSETVEERMKSLLSHIAKRISP